MAEWDWHQISLQGAFSALSGAGGFLFGLYRWGRKSAEDEQSKETAVKDDYNAKFKELREEMAEHAKTVEASGDLLVSQFRESFEGIRRQIDDHKLDVERRFLPKEDFREFREEYREDMREIKASIANIAR